ncbi:hypothetical protein V1264_006352 [Littorina saxatilis]|uniref:Uncharacterized protein n=2 Tax=Littorina saxatilis TaxID=31220 RepID=A0AAN9G4E4_9CAEN
MTPEQYEIMQLVKCRMQSLGLPFEEYYREDMSLKRNTISYVIINPSYDLKLEVGDIVYLIRPSSLSPQPSPLTDERKLLQDQKLRKRQDPTGAPNNDTEPTASRSRDTFPSNGPKTGDTSRRDGSTQPISGSRIPVIYYDSSDSDDETPSQPSRSTPIFQSQPLQTPINGTTTTPPHHSLERGTEFDVQTPDSPDIPMADGVDMNGNSSTENLAPRTRGGLSGTIV